MICVRCKSTMRKIARDNVLVDRCPDCGGIWLDAGELELLEGGDGFDKQEILIQARKELMDEARRMVTVVGLCPKCERSKLHKVSKRGVELDVCGHCEGIFFDEGELDRVLEGKDASFFATILLMVRG